MIRFLSFIGFAGMALAAFFNPSAINVVMAVILGFTFLTEK